MRDKANKSKRKPRTEFQRYESIFKKMNNELEEMARIRAERKAERQKNKK